MGRTTLKEEYFLWLYNHIGKKRRTYYKLCRELHRKAFKWSVHNDDNRAEDGLNLRDAFIEERNLDQDHLEVRYFLKADCSIFEVLVALAMRINDLMYDLESQEDNTSKWFMEMIGNLRLDEYTDNSTPDDRFSPVTEIEIVTLLDNFVDRAYDFHGYGGLFPLKKRPPQDQSRVEIWYQLMNYLDENYVS